MSAVRFSPSSRARLTSHDLGRFAGSTLFDRIGRALCGAGCLPRKEFYESWEVARRARRLFRGGRVVDLGGGHGLLAQAMLLLDESSLSAVIVDPRVPASAGVVHDALVAAWPRLKGRVSFLAQDMERLALDSTDVVVSAHGCGALTDRVIAAAIRVRARIAILPCCHDVETCATGDLTGWMDPALAIDATRVMRLSGAGYQVRTQTIPATITPKNRLILAGPL